jgi:hypothetical protein
VEMMRASDNENTNLQLLSPEKRCREVSAPVFLRTALIIFVLALSASRAWAGADVDLVQAAGGIPLASVGGGTSFQSTFGTLNALGIGTPATGVTAIPLSTGTLYITTFGIFPHGGLPAGHNVIVTGYVSTNFTHPAALIVESCPTASSCNVSGQFSVMSTNAGAQTSVSPAPGIPKGSTFTAGLGIFVPDNNGASAFSGTDSATITYTMIDSANGTVLETDPLLLNNPSETLQSAVRFTLGQATGGLLIGPGTDYVANYGNVNGLGIGPGSGLTIATVAGGAIYVTPYLLNVAFGDQSATTATIKVALTTNFAHPTVLQLDDSSSSGGPFTRITNTPLQITTTAADRGQITRYLGLFVSNTNNGAGAFTGTDNATLTFTLTVP